MTRRKWGWLAAAGLAFTATEARAQDVPRGGIVAFTSLYPGFYPGPFFGYYPGAYRGFYTNGFSLYGPPVPTYGPVAGTFGGSDQKIYPSNLGMGLPAIGVGIGWKKSVLPPPVQFRDYPHALPLEPVPATNPTPREAEGELAPPPRKLPPDEKAGASIEVRLPNKDAVVFIDGRPTRQDGTVRSFQSPPLDPGKEYTYDLLAEWREGGQVVRKARTVQVRSGSLVGIDFTVGDQAVHTP